MTYSVEQILDHELRFDQRPVRGTGFDALDPELWQPLLSWEEAADPVTSLERMAVLAMDKLGIRRATVTGVLLCARRPDRWLRNARITAIRYHGIDRTTRQVDAEEITGPLPRQISKAVNFCVRNMLVAARKTPMRIDMPQYSSRAIFEAVVNAVAHRDYSMHCSRIRISMFSNRLEIQSPGRPHRLRLEWIDGRCTTRNQAIASRLGWMDVGNVPGSGNRRYVMERRGDGVPSIIRETRNQPVRMVPGRELHLADSGGRALLVQLVWAAGRSVLLEYREAGGMR